MHACSLLVSLCLTLGTFGEAQVQPERLLILYEVGTAHPGVNQIEQGLRSAFETSHDRLEIYREYMETTLFPDPVDQERFRKFYLAKYKDRRPDVIITVGPSPLKFIVETHKRAFPGVPIVFCLPTWAPSSITLDSDFTGTINDLAPAETLEAAVRLRPDTKHVVVVGGTSYIDDQIEGTVKERLSPYERRFDISYLTNLRMADLLERLRHLPDHTIVLQTSLSRDAQGATFIGAEATSMVAAAANAPVFVLYDTFLNHEEVGGKLFSLRQQGRIAGELAQRILKGERPVDISRVSAGTVFMFDWHALQRWGMRESALPSGSIVVNRSFSIWESYGRYILSGICLILFQGLLIGGLLWQHARRRQATRILQKRTTEAKAREELLKIFVKNVPVGVAMLDGDLRYVQVSDRWCQDYGLDVSQVLGRSHYEVLPDMPEWWRQIHRRALDGETLRADEDRWERKGGTTWVRWEVRPWLSVDGTPGGILIFAEDITRRKQADEALSGMTRKLIESQEQERARIGRELHDDINQRLALVAVEFDRFKQSGSAKDFYDILEKAKDRIIKISTDVQALSHQLHSSKLEYLGLAAAAKSCCREFSEMHNVQVDFTHDGVPRNLPQEVALSLFRVLQEALQNAVKYSGTDHFEVELCGTGSIVTLKVSDFGRGFNVVEAMKSKGLGLASMRERINLANGEIVIKSDPMTGTEITAQVPVPTLDRTREVTSRSTKRMQITARLPRILLADDFPEIFEQVKKLLRNNCDIVGSACNGREAIKLCSALNPDILLLDISMPILSGFEVATRLKELGCRSKIIFLTGQEDRDYIDSAFSRGALAYVLKCRMGTDLLPAIDAALKGFAFTSPLSVQVDPAVTEHRQ